MRVLMTFAIALAATACHGAMAAFPDRPITFIVPLAPGSGADSSTRLIAELISKDLNVPVIVENKPGADSAIGIRHMLSSPADGYTAMFTTQSAVVLNPMLKDGLPYNAKTDLLPLAITTVGLPGYAVRSDSPYLSIQDLLAHARDNPGAITLASYGGETYGLLNRMLQHYSKVEFNTINYNSPATAMNDLIGGNVKVSSFDLAAARELVAGGKVRFLGTASANRLDRYPDVPTLIEQGLPGLEYIIWGGFVVRNGTPEDRLEVLSNAIVRALGSDEFKEYNDSRGAAPPLAYAYRQAARFVEQERQRFYPLMKEMGLNPREP